MTEKPFAPSVLILTDRLQDAVSQLSEYLRENTAIRILDVVSDSEGVLRVARENHIDFLIIAGYLKNEKTYEVLYELDKMQSDYLEVLWATFSPMTIYPSAKHLIRSGFERVRPHAEFVSHLEALYPTIGEPSERLSMKRRDNENTKKPSSRKGDFRLKIKSAWKTVVYWFNP